VRGFPTTTARPGRADSFSTSGRASPIPTAFRRPDGTIFISYDRNRDTDILLARFTEADVLAKELTGPKSKLKMLISRPLARRQAGAPK